MGTEKPKADLLPGTLDMLVLKILMRGHLHGYAIAQLIQQLSDDLLRVEEGSLYPALQRLELNGWIEGEWGLSANNRRARFYKTDFRRPQTPRRGVGPLPAGHRRGGPHYGVRLGHAGGERMRAGSRWKFFRRRLRYWLNHSERQRLLWEEMEFHIESMAEELVAQGMSEQEARAAAHRKFGNMTQQSEEARSTWIARWMSDLAQDLRHAFRGMRRDAGFTAFTILIAGLGIGASSTVFSVVNALLLRPLPFRDPGRLVWITNGDDFTTTQAEHYSDLRELNQSFSDLAGWSGYYRVGDKELTGTGEPERLTSVPVTGNFFPVLGVQPAIGRSFTAEECQGRYSAPPAIVLSYSFWRRRFASDPNVVGRKLTLNNQPVTVVGVLPASFDFGSVFAPGTPVDIFIPWPLNDKAKPSRKHDEDHRKTEARRDRAGSAG